MTFALALAGAAVGCVEDEPGSGVQTPVAGSGSGGSTSGGGGSGGGSAAPTGSLLPWKLGNKWTYRVTDEGVVSDKVTTIEAEEAVGGTGPLKDTTAFKVVTLKVGGSDQTISWQAEDGDKVIRYREQSFAATGGTVELEEHWSPYKLHIDGSTDHTKADATWIEEYEETKTPSVGEPVTATKRDVWTVDQADASVTVPAGTFEHAIVFTKAGGGDLKTYWYVRGVGKVKETGGQTEELEDYEVNP